MTNRETGHEYLFPEDYPVDLRGNQLIVVDRQGRVYLRVEDKAQLDRIEKKLDVLRAMVQEVILQRPVRQEES